MWKHPQPVAFDVALYAFAAEWIDIGSGYIDPGLQTLTLRAQTELLHVPSFSQGCLLAWIRDKGVFPMTPVDYLCLCIHAVWFEVEIQTSEKITHY